MSARILVLLLGLVLSLPGEAGSAPPEAAGGNTPQATVAELYDLVTFAPGTVPDWDRVRGLFIKEAVIVLKTSRENSTVFSLDGFVNDFVTFIDKANAKDRGFAETILRTSDMIHGDIAHVLVLYRAELGGSSRPPTQGIDSIQLIRQEDRWRIAAIVNEIVSPENPVPEVLKN